MTTHTPNMQNIVARDLSFGLRVGKVEGRGHRIERGRVMTSIELNHISLIIYRIPVSRVSTCLRGQLSTQRPMVARRWPGCQSSRALTKGWVE
jgi:hypothetical protein